MSYKSIVALLKFFLSFNNIAKIAKRLKTI